MLRSELTDSIPQRMALVGHLQALGDQLEHGTSDQAIEAGLRQQMGRVGFSRVTVTELPKLIGEERARMVADVHAKLAELDEQIADYQAMGAPALAAARVDAQLAMVPSYSGTVDGDKRFNRALSWLRQKPALPQVQTLYENALAADDMPTVCAVESGIEFPIPAGTDLARLISAAATQRGQPGRDALTRAESDSITRMADISAARQRLAVLIGKMERPVNRG